MCVYVCLSVCVSAKSKIVIVVVYKQTGDYGERLRLQSSVLTV